MSNLTVAAIQLTSTDEITKNLQVSARLVRQAADAGAQLVGLPENFAYLGSDRDHRASLAEVLPLGGRPARRGPRRAHGGSAGGVHARDRQGPLARAAARARHREPALPVRAGPARASRRAAAQLWARAGGRPLGRGDRRVREPRRGRAG